MILASYRRTITGAVPQFICTETMTLVEGPEQSGPAAALAWCQSAAGRDLKAEAFNVPTPDIEVKA
jgi:hypothetical protein